MPTPTNSYLPVPVSIQQGTVDVVTGASEPAKEKELYDHSYFLVVMQSAIASSSTWAAFRTAMAALPPSTNYESRFSKSKRKAEVTRKVDPSKRGPGFERV